MLLIACADYSRHSPPNLENLLAFLWFIFMLVIFSCIFTLSIVLGWAVWFPAEVRSVTFWTQQTCLKNGVCTFGTGVGKQLILNSGVLESSHRSECNYRNWSQTPLAFKLVQVWITTQYFLIMWEKLFPRYMFLWGFQGKPGCIVFHPVSLQLSFPGDWGSACISWIKLENSKFFTNLRCYLFHKLLLLHGYRIHLFV